VSAAAMEHEPITGVLGKTPGQGVRHNIIQ